MTNSKKEVDLVLNGPAEFDMQVYIINDETGQKGKATVGLGLFEYPTKEKVKARIQKFADEELQGAAPGFRLMTKREAWTQAMLEMTGEEFAMAGGPDWDEI